MEGTIDREGEGTGPSEASSNLKGNEWLQDEGLALVRRTFYWDEGAENVRGTLGLRCFHLLSQSLVVKVKLPMSSWNREPVSRGLGAF